ncbi:alpha/beta hydrolase [Ekhidna sp.]
MNRYFIILLLLLYIGGCKEDKSSLQSVDLFTSKFVEDRTIKIYLPPFYSSEEKYPVIYMHDGQMLFDSTTTWNGQEWGVDETMDELISNDEIRKAIVVGIWNGGSKLRHPEYFPQKPFESLDSITIDSLYHLKRSEELFLFEEKVQSDQYLKFIVDELKPYIDSAYSTLSDPSNTFLVGSSMGGLISFYGVSEYPYVFGGAACLSTHWPGVFTIENNPIPDAFFTYLESNLPNPSTHRFYFDYGTETLDMLYQDLQPKADSIFLSGGYNEENFLSKKFEGDAHNENAWRMRLHIPLKFLIAK